MGQCISVSKSRLSFNAIATISCIDGEGNLVATQFKEKSIKKEDVMEFILVLSEHTGLRPTLLYLDNLSSHRSNEVA